MRYAPTERFWRNLLLTCVFTVFTLGFSVASWHGLKVSSPERPALDGNRGIAKQMVAAESNVGYQEGARAARQGGAPLEDLDLGEVSPPVAAFAAGDSRATGAEAATAATSADADATGDRGRGQQSSAASSSGRGGAAIGGGGGFAGAGFGGGSSKNTQVSASSGKGPSPARNSSTKRNDKKGGGSNKGKTTKKTPTSGPNEAPGEKPSPLEGVYNGSPSGSPASTPEPLSMILVGTGLAGLYRVRKYLA